MLAFSRYRIVYTWHYQYIVTVLALDTIPLEQLATTHPPDIGCISIGTRRGDATRLAEWATWMGGFGTQ